jgi:O-methyltransferase
MISFFQVLNLIIILVVLVFLVRYAWGMFFDEGYEPARWHHARKQGLIDRKLLGMANRYADKVRFYNWWFQVERLKKEKVQGAFAELGVYRGESAKILHMMDPKRLFFLFDTFEGFGAKDLEGETGKAATYTTRNFADTSLEKVRKELGDSPNLVFCPGRFPESAISQMSSDKDQQFALVNIDADLYKPIKFGLEYFYPRMAKGGVILVHDYNEKWPGALQAVDEFIAEAGETLVTVPDLEGTVMVIK